MSVIRPKPPEDPIEYEPAAVFSLGGHSPERRDAIEAGLERTRKDLLGSGDVAMPDRLLDAYNTGGARAGSELFAILQAARRIRDTVDRVIVLGDGCGTLGARAVFESCAHPCHNELSRGERGGRPRLSFVCSSFDNDAIQGLLDLVAPAGKPRGSDLLEQWAVVVSSATDGGPEKAAATRLFLASLLESVGGDRAALADRLVPITTPTCGLADVATSLGCTSGFTIPKDIGDQASVFTPLGLLPAAIVGIDVVRLLQGAAAMNRRFREAPVAENPVLQFAAVSRLMAEQGGMARMFASPSSQLDAVGRWHSQCMAHRGLPLTTNLIVREPRRDPLIVPALVGCSENEDGLDHLMGTSWPEFLATARAADPSPPQAADTITLPRVDEHSIGQLLQFLVLANLVARKSPDAEEPVGGTRRSR
jgi:glucose-6-phosphate isomerase